jgi:hypothetical protein
MLLICDRDIVFYGISCVTRVLAAEEKNDVAFMMLQHLIRG